MMDDFDGRVSGAISTPGSPVSGSVTVPHSPYILPPATTEMLGGVIVGDDLIVDSNGVLSVNPELGSDVDEMTTEIGALHADMLCCVLQFREEYAFYNNHVFTHGDNSWSVQGSCYDSTRDHVILVRVKSDNSAQYLCVFDSDLSLISENAMTELGHANDLDYNPDTDEIYCSGGTSELVILDAATLAVKDTVDLSGVGTGNSWNVSYDPEGKVVYVGLNGKWYKTDSSFEEFTLWGDYNTDEMMEMAGLTNYLTQASVFAAGSLFFIFGGSAGDSDLYLARYAQDCSVAAIQQIWRGGENESGFVMDGRLYIVLGQQRVSFLVSELSMNRRYANIQSESYKMGRYIPENADLDDYVTAGRFTSRSSTVTNTLAHRPLTTMGPFTLEVFEEAAVGTIQEIRNNTSGILFTRTYIRSDDVWGPWREYLSVPTEIDLSSVVMAMGLVTSQGKAVMFTIPFTFPQYDEVTFGSSTAWKYDLSSCKISLR